MAFVAGCRKDLTGLLALLRWDVQFGQVEQCLDLMEQFVKGTERADRRLAGVQWHPEVGRDQALFPALFSAAGERRLSLRPVPTRRPARPRRSRAERRRGAERARGGRSAG